jgi:hypothetical protein
LKNIALNTNGMLLLNIPLFTQSQNDSIILKIAAIMQNQLSHILFLLTIPIFHSSLYNIFKKEHLYQQILGSVIFKFFV